MLEKLLKNFQKGLDVVWFALLAEEVAL